MREESEEKTMLERDEVARGLGPTRKANWKPGFVECPPGRVVRGILLANRLLWYDLHWVGSHQVCTIPSGICGHCHVGIPTTRHAYSAVILEGETVQRILHITSPQALECPALLQRDLRGVNFRMAKTGPSARSKTRIDLEGAVFNIENLPVAIDVDTILRRQWDSKRRFNKHIRPAGGAA
jgi:hypothetical protein